MRIVVIGASAVAESLAALMTTSNIQFRHIPDGTTVSTGDLKHVDWVIEATGFDKANKIPVLKHLSEILPKTCLLSTDESIVPRAELAHDVGLGGNFLVSHFFLPVQTLPLLELVSDKSADSLLLGALRAFCTERLGRELVIAPDSPGFIANRIGLYCLARGIRLALDSDIAVHDADAAAAAELGLPRSGVFGLVDLIGLQLTIRLINDLIARLAADDPMQACSLAADPKLSRLLARDGDSRFYHRDPRSKQRMSLDCRSLEYRNPDPGQPISAEARAFAQLLRKDVTQYAARLARIEKISASAINLAVSKGYGWSRGVLEEVGSSASLG